MKTTVQTTQNQAFLKNFYSFSNFCQINQNYNRFYMAQLQAKANAENFIKNQQILYLQQKMLEANAKMMKLSQCYNFGI